MGRRKSKGKRSGSHQLGDRITSVAFKGWKSISLSSGSGSMSIHPNQFSRTNAVADAFLLYRCVRLSIHVFPPYEADVTFSGAEGGSKCAVGYVSNITDTTTGNNPDEVIELTHSVGMLSNGICTASGIAVAYTPTVGSKTLVLDRKALCVENSLKWFKADLGTPESWDELQGIVLFATDCDATTWQIMYSGVFEFCSPVDVSINPEWQTEIVTRREKISCRLREVSRKFEKPRSRSTPGLK